MDMKDEIAEHDRLNAAFASESVFTADKKELERLLWAATEIKPKDPANVERAKRRSEVIRMLIGRADSLSFAKWTRALSIVAIIVSLLSATFAGIKARDDIRSIWRELRGESSSR